ncbi:hypothetical protein JCGZ_21526 [Jatropha curcas]|uniref:RING-type E3 ubiquitin transferase n=1 Tax=Jatropha curcas TaxID=180498 RepID=A0A067JM25_JATCU|nr:hypothetical protein JCGZ_21526 [Jatropha curcas]
MGHKDDDDREFGVSRKVMLAAILSLFTAVLLIVFLYLYSRYIISRRQERARRAAFDRLSRQIATDVAVVNYFGGPVKTGLDPLVIASFPTFPYKLSDQKQLDRGEARETECSVCLGTVVESAMVRVLPNCKHMFHVECIDTWLGSNTTCPICRTVAEPRTGVEERELGTETQPSAPPVEMEKGGGSSGSRLGSFRWMVTRDRSSRTRSCGEEICETDMERQ